MMRRWSWASLFASVCLLIACGGGGGVGEGGTGSFASGPITGFGSVMVGGIRFDDSTATIDAEDDDALPSLARLQQGMVVAVEAGDIVTAADGSRTAQARHIRVLGSTVGPVTDVDLLGRSLRVLGLRVRYNAATVFDAALRERLRGGQGLLGQVVEIWGYVDPQLPGVVATYVQLRESVPASFRARGLVRRVEGATVEIGDQTFDFSAATDRPSVGSLVRVVVDAASAPPNWRVLRWHTIAAPSGSREGERAGLEGIVTAVTDARHFRIDGVPVVSDADVAGLAVGVYMEVDGTWQTGTLVATATKVSSESELDAREIKWEGSPSALDTVARRFTVTTSAGRQVSVAYDDTTAFDGGTADGLQVTSARVEVRGRWNNGELLARRIKFR